MRFPSDATKPLRVEVALNPATDAPEWRDVSALVKGDGVKITRGGGRRHEDVPAGRCSLTLDNRDGAFSDVSGMTPALYRKRIRVSYRTPGIDGNLLSAESASFEGGTVGAWVGGGSVPPALTNSATHPASGTKGMLVTWGAGGLFPSALLTYFGLTIGRTYTFSGSVWVPVGSPTVRLVASGIGLGAPSTTFGATQRISVTFTATNATQDLSLAATSAPTAGQQCWADGFQLDEGSSVRTFTTAAPPISYRFTGRVATNDLSFPALGLALTSLTATDEIAWQGSSYSTLRSVPVQEILVDDPAGLWTLADGDLGDVSGSGSDAVTLADSGAAPIYDQDLIGASTSAKGATFTGGQYLAAKLSRQVAGFFSTGLTAETVVRTTTTIEGVMVGVGDFFGPRLLVSMDPDGKPRARLWQVFTPGVYAAEAVSTAAVNDGQPHHVAARWTTASGTLALFVDGSLVASDIASVGSSPMLLLSERVTVGGTTVLAAPFTGLLAHVAVTDAALSNARISEHAAALLTGFRGEGVAARLARYNAWAGNPFGTVTDASNAALVGYYDTEGKSIADAIGAVATVEDGLTFVGGDGSLIARGRSTFINATPAYTIPGPLAGQASRVQGGLKYTSNPLTAVVNDMTGSMPGGVTQRVIDSGSINEWGRSTASVEGPFIDEAALAAVIEWRVNTDSEPVPDADGMEVRLSLLTDAETAALLAVDIGSVIAWTGMPSQAPTAADRGVVLGIDETYSSRDLLWGATLAPNPGALVLIADDPVRGLADHGFIAAY